MTSTTNLPAQFIATSRCRDTRLGAWADPRTLLHPRYRDELLAFLGPSPADTPVFFLGLGTNLLVRDGGVRGVVIDTARAERLERVKEAESSARRVCCPGGSRASASSGELVPREFLAGIPGTSVAHADERRGFRRRNLGARSSVECATARGIDKPEGRGEYKNGYRQRAPSTGGVVPRGAVRVRSRPRQDRGGDEGDARSARRRNPSANRAAARCSRIPRAITPPV